MFQEETSKTSTFRGRDDPVINLGAPTGARFQRSVDRKPSKRRSQGNNMNIMEHKTGETTNDSTHIRKKKKKHEKHFQKATNIPLYTYIWTHRHYMNQKPTPANCTLLKDTPHQSGLIDVQGAPSKGSQRQDMFSKSCSCTGVALRERGGVLS